MQDVCEYVAVYHPQIAIQESLERRLRARTRVLRRVLGTSAGDLKRQDIIRAASLLVSSLPRILTTQRTH